MSYKNIKQQGLYDPQFEHDNCGVGFVVNIKGIQSNEIVKQGLEILHRLSHRGAVGADPKTGDGAGILIQIPHEYFSEVALKSGIKLPHFGGYGTGLVFLPQDKAARESCKTIFKKIVEKEGQHLLGWREVPIDDSEIGETARKTQPKIEQIFIGKGKRINDRFEFERKLYYIRRLIEKEMPSVYIANISSRTFVYKGLLMPEQVKNYFIDLKDERLKSAIALVHSRYSTNTFPTWDLAQPFRFLAHNGEINTLRGNINWMKARGIDVIVPGGSDSAALDNVVEYLILSGRSLPHVMMMLIPQAWEHNKLISKNLRDFYQFHACFMEPWDGPAAVALTDGTRVAAALDRNGLRPARYIITDNDLVIMASEAGVLDIKSSSIIKSGRLEPGKIFYIDTELKKVIDDVEIKEQISFNKPYGEWIENNLISLKDLPKISSNADPIKHPMDLFKAFGYSREDLKILIKPMAEKGKEPIGSMGNDSPHAILSDKPKLVYEYFKQLFAQVTNPPIDPIREEVVMSFESYLGASSDILRETPEHCLKLKLESPILLNDELEKLKEIRKKGFSTKTISLLFKADSENNLLKRLDEILKEAESAVISGYSLLILSDRGVSQKFAAIPSLIAVGAVHHHLIKMALRTKASLIIESGDAREVHHFALLLGYGVDAVNPYLAYEAIEQLVSEKEIFLDAKTAINNYCHAIEHGILKILSKMGISTLHSYRGAQIFEALGISQEVIEKCFIGTPSRISGATFEVLSKELLMRHKEAFPDSIYCEKQLISGGLYQWRRDGEFHLWNPDSIALLQDSVRKGDFAKFKEFSALINDQSKNPTTLRSLLKIKQGNPIALSEVEPVLSILKRFATGAMSFGSISRGAHETIAIAMNEIGGRSNTGEGGEDPERFKDNRRSSIKQVASGRFGVNTNYLVNADELQIKIAQGAKPGEGGQLPGHKVSEIIAKTRYTTPGVTLISPPPHHDIYSIEDLAQLIFDLKNVNPRARISVKLVSEVGVGTVAAGVAKGHADMILISGGDGGTGASPLSSIKHAGLPWELGLAETHQTLVLNDLRSRVRIQTDGQLRTGRDVAIAALLGAEEFGFATGILIALGCVMLRHCHLNNCSLGVATQDEFLSKRFAGKPEYIINYMKFMAQELREIMASLGIKNLDEMIGRSDLLEVNNGIIPWKARGIDFSKILYKPATKPATKRRGLSSEEPRSLFSGSELLVEDILDRALIEKSRNAIENKEKIEIEAKISNINRTTGGMLSGEVCRRHGNEGLLDNTINVKFSGIAGQSFGAWLAHGITFELEGMANDYVGKGISGGKVIIYPDKNVNYEPSHNVIIGNTAFYGAISGEAFIGGKAGERFCIRNSGLNAVVEGVGDHGCEYMTGGRVVVLGETGRNFAAGMSGGIAYIYDKTGDFPEKCNQGMVMLENILSDDEKILLQLLERHYEYTGSLIAKKITDNFIKEKRRFVKVMPVEYKRIMLEKAMDEEELDLLGVSDG